MSYTALYRKFRPQDFEDVKGQDHIVTALKNQVKANRLGHAYLFTGTRGTGKTTVAKILAKAVNCEHPVDGSPCNECETCKRIAEGSSMNVFEIDAASNNSVSNIRDIVEEVAYSPTEGKYKVYIIDEVHMLSASAFAALLKTLEEPPAYVIFILATTEVHMIPITILSRCQRYDFRRISIDTIAGRLQELMVKENISVEDKALRYVAKAADGSMRDALSLLDQCIAFYLGENLTYDKVLQVLGAVDNEIFSQLLPNADDSLLPHRITLLFAGDLMQHQGQINAARTPAGYDYSDCFKFVKEEISRADIAIANLEVTLGGKPYRGYPAFSAPDEYLSAIREAGFNVLITANNHCLDRGKKGLERTILMLDSLRIPYAGTYTNAETREQRYPLMIEKNGFRIVLLNYTYGTNGLKATSPNIVNYIDKETMALDIRKAKALQPDVLIACIHWGEEYQSLPNREQTSLADWLLQQGVTHIIGSHPHVVQPMELRTDSTAGSQHAVVYSLGNFISNMSARRTDGGILFKLELEKDSITRVTNCEYGLVWTSRPVLSRKKNYILYPINYPTDSLSVTERNHLKIFTKDTRSLFNKHNKGIKEYIFY